MSSRRFFIKSSLTGLKITSRSKIMVLVSSWQIRQIQKEHILRRIVISDIGLLKSMKQIKLLPIRLTRVKLRCLMKLLFKELLDKGLAARKNFYSLCCIFIVRIER